MKTEAEHIKMSQGYLVVPESKEMLKKEGRKGGSCWQGVEERPGGLWS